MQLRTDLGQPRRTYSVLPWLHVVATGGPAVALEAEAPDGSGLKGAAREERQVSGPQPAISRELAEAWDEALDVIRAAVRVVTAQADFLASVDRLRNAPGVAGDDLTGISEGLLRLADGSGEAASAG
jgi:hypothetical protein